VRHKCQRRDLHCIDRQRENPQSAHPEALQFLWERIGNTNSKRTGLSPAGTRLESADEKWD